MAPTNHQSSGNMGVSGKMSTGLTTASIGLGILAGVASVFSGGASLAAYMGYMAAMAGIAAGAAGVSSAVGEKKAGVSTWKRDLGISIGTAFLSGITFGAGAAISAGAKSSMALNTYRVGVGVGLGMGTYGAIDQSVKVATGETKLGKGHVWDTLNFTNAVVGGVMSVGQAGGIVSSASKGGVLKPAEIDAINESTYNAGREGTYGAGSESTLGDLPMSSVKKWQGNISADRKGLPNWFGKKSTVSTVAGDDTTPIPGTRTAAQEYNENVVLPRRMLFGKNQREGMGGEHRVSKDVLMVGDPTEIRGNADLQTQTRMFNQTKVGVGLGQYGIGKLTKPIAINAGMNISAATAGLGIVNQSSQASEKAMYQSTVTTVTVGIDNQS